MGETGTRLPQEDWGLQEGLWDGGTSCVLGTLMGEAVWTWESFRSYLTTFFHLI